MYDALTAELCDRFGLHTWHVSRDAGEVRELSRSHHALYRYRPMRNDLELDRACGEALRGCFYFPTRTQLQDDFDLGLKVTSCRLRLRGEMQSLIALVRTDISRIGDDLDRVRGTVIVTTL